MLRVQRNYSNISAAEELNPRIAALEIYAFQAGRSTNGQIAVAAPRSTFCSCSGQAMWLLVEQTIQQQVAYKGE
jgi:hypothetical protein